MEELAVQLDSYSRMGIPKLNHNQSAQDSTLEDKVEEGKWNHSSLEIYLAKTLNQRY